MALYNAQTTIDAELTRWLPTGGGVGGYRRRELDALKQRQTRSETGVVVVTQCSIRVIQLMVLIRYVVMEMLTQI